MFLEDFFFYNSFLVSCRYTPPLHWWHPANPPTPELVHKMLASSQERIFVKLNFVVCGDIVKKNLSHYENIASQYSILR